MFGEIKLNNFLLPLSIRIIERLLHIKEFHQTQQNAKKKNEKKLVKLTDFQKLRKKKLEQMLMSKWKDMFQKILIQLMI